MGEIIPQPTRSKWRFPALVTGFLLSSVLCSTLALAVKSDQSDYELQILSLQNRGCAITKVVDSSVSPFGGDSMNTVFGRREIIRENWGIWEGKETLLECPDGSELLINYIFRVGMGGYSNQITTRLVYR